MYYILHYMSDVNVHANIGNKDSLQVWARSIEQEISEIESKLIPLQQRREAAIEKLDLVRRLINLSTHGQNSTAGMTNSISSEPQLPTVLKIEDQIEAILCAREKPMHIREIHAALVEKGVPLPGKGDEANIILRLRRDTERFVRTGRGTYALVTWNLPAYFAAPRKKRIRRAAK
jgi:hypothetical protein